jgi:hypothetical protein
MYDKVNENRDDAPHIKAALFLLLLSLVLQHQMPNILSSRENCITIVGIMITA